MRHHIIASAAMIMASLLLSSCEGNQALGGWDPMDLSDKQLVFSESGGTATVYCYNRYPSLQYIQDMDTGKYKYSEVSRDGSYVASRYDLSYHGLSVKIAKDVITVSVDPAEGEHRWTISLQSGDTWAGIRVYQNCSPDGK